MAGLDLGNNSLTGPIPASLGRLPRLKSLILKHNQLSGRIPSTVFNMSSVTHLSFTANNLSGPLVTDHNTNFTIPLLEFFSVESNQLNGTVPHCFLQCQNLQVLSLSTNYFSGGIPTELAKLNKLSILFLDTNYLLGSIPPSFGNLTYLTQLDLSFNHLQGKLPPELGNLLNLQRLWLGDNNLTGELPAFLSNMSMIRVMDFQINNLSGRVPTELGKNLPFLTTIALGWNKVSGGLDFINSLSNCRQLQNIYLLHNELEGVIPDSIANLSTSVMKFSIRGNHIAGGIPAGFSNLSNLIFLNLLYNKLTGTIPLEIAKIATLQQLFLGYNTLTGSIPPELGQLKSLCQLGFEGNALSGAIPDSIGNISTVQVLWLHTNKLSSSIPQSIWSLRGLVGLYLSQNALEGIIHPDAGNLMNINQLTLSANQLSGSIPDTLGQLQMLEVLDLSNNSFNGLMPQSLGKLISIEYLDLSHNEFSGPIPNSLADLHHLATLNLSFNKLEGPIPSGGVFSNISFQSLMGNAALCGLSKLGFSPCVIKSTNFHSTATLHKLKIILPTIALPIMLFSCFFILYWQKDTNVVSTSKIPHLHEYSLIPYHELARATDGFSESNFLGRGSSGSVYRGRLDDGSLIAVKVLDLENKTSLRSFESECRALGMIRHRNLVRIISTCSNLDFKALVLQYMPNGSLERWLYSSPECCLTLLQRINIILDVALALEYLHHQLHQVVVHCDVKPSNILLDEEMNARLSDFGIAKRLASDSKSLVSASIAGTFGYMPPGMLMVLLFIFFYPQLTISLELSNFTDHTALLSFKSHIQDPNSILDKSWNSNTSFCNWIGVSCSSRRQRVVALRLEGLSLQGTISPQLGNLSFMAYLDLGNNSLTGPIPDSLGRLPRLKSLILKHNQLSGRIPSSIFNMSSLTQLSFGWNNLSGALLTDHRSNFTIPHLQYFSVESNQLSGAIPSGFLQCQNLQVLSLSTNYFSGSIPTELTNLQKLSILYLDTNYLIGSIPPSLGNLTYLTQLDLSSNHLQGEIPPEVGDLLNLQWLTLGENTLTGELPASLSNISMIRVMDFSINNLTGRVPIELGKNLPFLTTIGLSWNKVSGGLDFINSLSNCKQLQNIYLLHNELEGVIPDSIANLSTSVTKFSIRGNRIAGGIPAGFSNLTNLIFLNLHSNELTGNIPPEIAKIGSLQQLFLGYNKLTGSIPPELGQLKSLNQLSLEGNALSGAIPDTIGNISTMQVASQILLDSFKCLRL
ncbi:putative LRR receptor-like serine/threonine-protein kinase [Ananas comosus]|uniref:non-specific serine/threonine protein kinase n=1 Tax=Ananas comosus TaxID=4615 RepID=A0A199VF47_ANACO|nr:putative LRR receptor-like serine/threonine-protein kinase [Ananas comosus]